MATFADAMTASMTAKLDPMSGILREFARAQTSELLEQLQVNRLETMALIRRTIKECQDGGEDPKVIAAYQRMLDSYTK